MSKKKTDLARKVMEQIEKEEVKMKPRLYFLAGSLLLSVGLGMAVVFGAFFINLAFFRLRVHEPLGYLWFGQFGLKPFIFTFPWLRLIIAVICILLGIILLRRYEISYKKSFLALAIGLVVLVLTTGFLIDKTGLNERVGQLKPLRPFYREQFTGQGRVVGEIIEIKEREMEISTPEGEAIKISWDEKTLLPFGGDFKTGEGIKAVGEWQDEETFKARGISRGKKPWLRSKEDVKGIKQGPGLRRPFP